MTKERMAGNTREKRNTRKVFWGYHLVVNAGNCDKDAIRSSNTIKEFTKTLVNKIGMVAYGAPRVVMFGEGNKKGYTLVQLIETSNITAHFVEETNDVYLDIFSCKGFKIRDALSVFREFFKPETLTTKFLRRQAGQRPKGQRPQAAGQRAKGPKGQKRLSRKNGIV